MHASGTWRRYAADDKPLARQRHHLHHHATERSLGRSSALRGGRDGSRRRGSIDEQRGRTQGGHGILRRLELPRSRLASRARFTIRTCAWPMAASRFRARRRTFRRDLSPDGSARGFKHGSIRRRSFKSRPRARISSCQFSRLGRDGRVLSTDEGVFLAVVRDGVWKIQARSTMGLVARRRAAAVR